MCPIHIAARFGYKEIVKALIENGADINIKGYFGYTTLHEACRKNNIDIVNILIKNGADLNIKSGRYGFMPLYLACENNYEEIIYILIKNGANLGLEPNHKVWRLDLPYREEEYFMERTSNYFQFMYEEEDLSEPCEITTDLFILKICFHIPQFMFKADMKNGNIKFTFIKSITIFTARIHTVVNITSMREQIDL